MRIPARSFVATFVLSLASLSTAWAEPAAPPPAATVSSPAPAPATSSEPNIDRGFLLPTAMTQPAGSVTYNNYELLLHGVTYGVTDRVQASITVLSPITKEMPFLGIVAVKGRIVTTPRFHLALQGSFGYGHELGGSASGSAYTLGAGVLGSACLRADCSSLLSASATYELAAANGFDDRAHMVVYGGSIVHGVTPHLKLLAEVTSAAGGNTFAQMENAPGALFGYGVRFYGSNMAGDIGFIKPIVDGDDGGLLLGIPFVNVSYRWQ